MARPRNVTPTYRYHKPSGNAYSDYTDPITGRRRSVCLGPWDSEASRISHSALCAELAVGAPPPTSDLSASELLLRYLNYAAAYYVKDGQPTDEIHCLKAALRPVHELYGLHPAATFGPLELRAVQHRLSADGMARKTVNKHVGRIRRVWRWGVAEGMVPPEALVGLEAVASLKKGRCSARESAEVRPVADAVVERTLPHLSAVVRTMVQLQRLTGMRPDEVCRVRPCDVDRTGEVWLFTPNRHKTEHHGRRRVVAIGPRGQQVLAPFLARDPEAFCFDPREAVAELRERQRAERDSREGGSGGDRKPPAENPRRAAGQRYKTDSYRTAIQRACEQAFPAPTPLCKGADESFRAWHKRLTKAQKVELGAWRRKNRWHPNQLRHTAATEIRRHLGIDAARAALGHTDTRITEIYAERDTTAAIEAAKLLG